MTGNSSASPSRRKAWRWLGDIVLLVLVVVAVQWWQSRDLARDDAPVLVGLLVDGTPYQLEPGPTPILVHFWAEWCPVCRLEQDSIAALSEDHAVITVATTSGSPADVQAYLDNQGLAMPVLMDQEGQLARQWGVNGVPATFIVDPAGKIVHASKGYSTEVGLRIRLWLAG